MTEERVEELAEKAAALHRSGYNCAQAVACALSGEVGVDEDLCFRLMEGFGLGMGQMHETCGGRFRRCGCSWFSKQPGQGKSYDESVYL